jgi:outer membrane protein assembly factor BamB
MTCNTLIEAETTAEIRRVSHEPCLNRAAAHAVLACYLFVSSAAAEGWPVYLGPRQNGTSAETGLLLDWSSDGPPRVWSKRLGPSFSPPVVAKGRLVVAHRIDDEVIVECLEADTGKTRWEFRYPSRYADSFSYNGGPRSSPTIDGDRVYTYGAEGVLTCLDLATGNKVWQRRLNAQLKAPKNFFGVGVPPIIEKDLILLNLGAPDGAGVVGVDKNTGKTAWKASDHGPSYSAPVVYTIHGRRMAVFLTQKGLLIVEPATGNVLHDFPFRSPLYYSVNAASPVVVDDVVFLSAAYTVGSIALRVTPDELTTVWRNKKSLQNHWATSIYHDGHLYGTHGRHEKDAVMRCIDWATGALRWSSPPGLGRTTFIMAQGHLLVMGERGYLALVKVTPERYVEKERVRLLDYPCWAPPVLANGLLYLRSERALLCLDLRSKK